ncbi:PilZ domain-containing protein [Caulobacter sp. CCUG 60055]|nr:PilZ domain-containing protein [Caulobacter sp. CCUG 60055]
MAQISPVRTEAAQRWRTSRQRRLFACRIVFGPGAFTLDGMIRDVSDSGARIRLPSPMPLPKSFRVILRDGVCQETETVWRRGQELGVRFLAPVDLQDPTDASVRMLRRLWAEMAGRANDMTAPSI